MTVKTIMAVKTIMIKKRDKPTIKTDFSGFKNSFKEMVMFYDKLRKNKIMVEFFM